MRKMERGLFEQQRRSSSFTLAVKAINMAWGKIEYELLRISQRRRSELSIHAAQKYQQPLVMKAEI